MWLGAFAAVAYLLALCSPAAIFWLVVAVGVNAVDAQSQRTLTHVGQEVRERMSPAVANGDAATTVMVVIVRIWVNAALDHGNPRIECFGLMTAPCMPVYRAAFPHDLTASTATGCGCTRAEIARTNPLAGPAIAPAVPLNMAAATAKEREYDQASEAIPGQVLPLHGLNISPISAMVKCNYRT